MVYADESYLYIFEGPDGAVLLEEGEHANRTQYEYPVIVDLDGDHHAEIVLASCDDFEDGWAGVTALGDPGESGWWMARPIWNQHAFFFDNVKADGISLPPRTRPRRRSRRPTRPARSSSTERPGSIPTRRATSWPRGPDGNEQDHAWTGAAQDTLDAWLAAR